MKFKIVAGLLVVALGFLVLQARAQSHQHAAAHGGTVLMFGSSDHAEIVKSGSALIVHMSDANRKALKISDFEVIKVALIKDSKDLELKADKSKDDSSLKFSLPPDDFSKAGVKVTVKRKNGNTGTFSQAIPMSKISVN